MFTSALTVIDPKDLEQATRAISSMNVKTAVTALCCLAGGIAVTQIILHILKRLMKKDRLEKTAGHFLVVFLRVFLLLLTFIITLDRLGLPVTSLVALLSMFALAVSLSVQNVMSNVVNGIVILVNKPFRAGDFIETGAVSGTVKDINLVYTRVVTVDNRLVMVPNSAVSSAQVTNYSVLPVRRLEVSVRVSMAENDRAVMDALLAAAKRAMPECEDEKCELPEAMPVAFDGPNIRFAVRVWTPSADYRRVNKKLLLSVREVFAERGIKMV